MGKYQAPRGTYDVLPDDAKLWQYIEQQFRNACKAYNFGEIRTPIFEKTELFTRSVGETSDIVGKEMYTFDDKKGRSMTLRPEGTAGVVRAFIENKMFAQKELNKLFYLGPIFRYERPKSGRFRQFVQFGAEAIGAVSAELDAEMIMLISDFLKRLEIKNYQVLINTLGDDESRTIYRKKLQDHFRPHLDELCSDCQTRFEKNPLRILDCKVDSGHESFENAPTTLDNLSVESKEYFDKVIKILDLMNINYKVDPSLVRGLDYYNHTVFEFVSTNEQAPNFGSFLGGGRYNGMVEQLGGPDLGGIGFAFGAERLLEVLKIENRELSQKEELDCYIITMDEKSSLYGLEVLKQLREADIVADKDYFGKKMKGQFKQADKTNAKLLIIIGDEEVNEKTLSVKDANREQYKVKQDDLVTFIKEKLNG